MKKIFNSKKGITLIVLIITVIILIILSSAIIFSFINLDKIPKIVSSYTKEDDREKISLIILEKHLEKRRNI